MVYRDERSGLFGRQDGGVDPGQEPWSTVAQRAQDLAYGVRTFQPDEALPQALWETAYLLAASQDQSRPLLERLRILGLVATTLDQFFAEELPQWRRLAQDRPEYAELLRELPTYLEPLFTQSARVLRYDLIPSLEAEYDVRINSPDSLASAEQQWLRRFFQTRVYPLLTPLAVDPGHPFPFISSFSLNFLVHLQRPGPVPSPRLTTYARIKVPALLPRFIRIPHRTAPREDRPVQRDMRNGAEEPHHEGYLRSGRGKQQFVPSEELVRFFLPELFPGLTVADAALFRVIRASEPEERQTIINRSRTRQRQLTQPVTRLDVEADVTDDLLSWLVQQLQVPAYASYRIPDQLAQLQLVDLANLIEGVNEPTTLLFNPLRL